MRVVGADGCWLLRVLCRRCVLGSPRSILRANRPACLSQNFSCLFVFYLCIYSCIKFRYPTAFTLKRVKGGLLRKNSGIYLGCNIIFSRGIPVAISYGRTSKLWGASHNYEILGIFSSHECQRGFSQPLVYGHTPSHNTMRALSNY
jgi:hypothetical protein